MKHSLFAAFLTTVSRQQAWQSFCLMLQPWKWNDQTAVSDFLISISTYLSGNTGLADQQQLVPFYNARSALYHGLDYLGVGSGDVVAVQGYTCVSVINAIKAVGATPLYVDITRKTLNMDPVVLASLLKKHSVKVVIIQHTLGIVADIKAIRSLCDAHGCQLLEDCAHSLGASYQDKKVGLRGDVSIFSFGRDKIISSVNGGVLLLNTLRKDHRTWRDGLIVTCVSYRIVLKNLSYAIVGYLASLTYDFFTLGKGLYRLSGKAKLFPEIVSMKEKSCNHHDLSFAFPPVLARLASAQIAHIDEKNSLRKKHATTYHEALGRGLIYVERKAQRIDDVYLRCVYLVDHSQRGALIQKLKRYKIHPGDRYQQVVAPKGVFYDAIDYEPGMCPVAEKVASMTINIPNHAGIGNNGSKRVLEVLA